ncbi:MAG: adenylosuccinate synthase [Candidatus Gastranaerophilales bacterium]|nr:adenylosuccinate synthase [Candidatus Gastranaerophilales bacterium]
MTNVVIVGGQWGDEGKAKIIDLLSEKADIVIRYQGGCNAGHTVVTGGQTYKFHLIPSGILYPGKICLIGNGVVVNPQVFMSEVEGLQAKGIDTTNLYISPLAHLTLPYHIALDELSEESLQNNKIGTTKRGIGPTYIDKVGRTGIRMEDLFEEGAVSDKLDIILPQKNTIFEYYGKPTVKKSDMLEFCNHYAEKLAPYVKDFSDILQDALKTGKTILFEGAQGTMLDIDHGTYPFVTSSSPIAAGASIGSGVGMTKIQKVVGVFKAYITRVGEGPFLTELNDEYGEKLQNIGKEVGTTTGRKRRCGWFDAVVARYSAMVNGLTGIALTKIDVFDNFDEIKVCVAYQDTRNGKLYRNYPLNTYIHKHLEPVYKTVSGWKQDISGVRTFSDLPQAAQDYVAMLEKETGVPIEIISVGAEREQTIIRG